MTTYTIQAQNIRAKQVLLEAAAKLAKPGAWIQGNSAKDEAFNAVLPTNPKACRFCMSGAIENVSPSPRDVDLPTHLLRLKLFSLGAGSGIAEWNDTTGRTQKEVVDLMREVAEGIPNGDT